MSTHPVKTILTHENPDLDAMLAVFLFKEYGEAQFSGARTANIAFCSADKLPDGKSSDELERAGIMAVDIGGGRFDTHPVQNKVDREKVDRCASDLVAETLGLLDHPQWRDLIEYTRLQDTQGRSLVSRNHLHNLVSLNTILLGFQIIFRQDSAKILDYGIEVIKYISQYALHKETELDTQALLIQFTERYLENLQGKEELSPCVFENFLAWKALLPNDFEAAFSSESPFDQLVSLKAILIGCYHASEQDLEVVYQRMVPCFDAIIARERGWCDALHDVDTEAVVKTFGRITIVTIASENGMVIRVARFRLRADMIIYRNPLTGATTLIINRRGPLARFKMHHLAAKVRLAEATLRTEQPLFRDLRRAGTVHEWFLHQSNNMLICGSLKATSFRPSIIPLDTLGELVYSELDSERSIPAEILSAYIEYRRYFSDW